MRQRAHDAAGLMLLFYCTEALLSALLSVLLLLYAWTEACRAQQQIAAEHLAGVKFSRGKCEFGNVFWSVGLC